MFISFLMTGTVDNLTHLQGHHKNIKTSEAFPAGIKIGFTPCDWCVSPPKFRSICLIHHDSSIHLKKVISNHYKARYLVHWHRSDKWRIRRWYSTCLPATRTRILCWRPGFSGYQPNPRSQTWPLHLQCCSDAEQQPAYAQRCIPVVMEGFKSRTLRKLAGWWPFLKPCPLHHHTTTPLVWACKKLKWDGLRNNFWIWDFRLPTLDTIVLVCTSRTEQNRCSSTMTARMMQPGQKCSSFRMCCIFVLCMSISPKSQKRVALYSAILINSVYVILQLRTHIILQYM